MTTIATQLDALAAQFEDTDSEYQVLQALLYAVKNDYVDEMEAALVPLVTKWMADHVGMAKLSTDYGVRVDAAGGGE